MCVHTQLRCIQCGTAMSVVMRMNGKTLKTFDCVSQFHFPETSCRQKVAGVFFLQLLNLKPVWLGNATSMWTQEINMRGNVQTHCCGCAFSAIPEEITMTGIFSGGRKHWIQLDSETQRPSRQNTRRGRRTSWSSARFPITSFIQLSAVEAGLPLNAADQVCGSNSVVFRSFSLLNNTSVSTKL